MSLTILLGDYGSGKTTTAKRLAKQTGGKYLDVDLLAKNINAIDDSTLIDKLRVILEPNNDYYMDGYPAGYGYGMIKPEALGTSVKYIACLASPRVIQSRQQKKAGHTVTALPRTIDEIKRATTYAASIALTYDADPLFADTTTYPPTLWRKDNWITRWLEINLYAILEGAGEYQDVELGDRTIVGLSKSYKTWDRLKALVDFNGKRVIDYGCNYGYFCFKAEEAGASSITGVDESKTVLNMATNISMTKFSRTKFLTSELKNFNPPDTDIIMALNVLHHLDCDKGVLDKMFKCAGMVVLEMPFKDLPLVDTVACSYRFGKPVIASSHREGRCIAIYSKAKPVVLPRKFVYHPKRATFTKWLYNRVIYRFFALASKVLPLVVIGTIRGVLRYLWMKMR